MSEEKKSQEEKKDKDKKRKKDYKELSRDWENKYKRALADYQNLVKENARSKQEFAKYANEQLILEILPVFDNLKEAFKHFNEEESKNGWLEGIKYVIKQFRDALENNGVKEIKVSGEKFDHQKMEAVENQETDNKKNDGLVAKELKPGYELNGKVIIPSRVVVYKYKKNF